MSLSMRTLVQVGLGSIENFILQYSYSYMKNIPILATIHRGIFVLFLTDPLCQLVDFRCDVYNYNTVLHCTFLGCS